MAYQEINEIFQQHDTTISAAEAHGIATAMLCVDIRTEVNDWLDQLFEEDVGLVEQDKATLIALFERTRALLNPEETEFEFDLFFPVSDDLQELAIALSNWCQGFLWGIGYSHSAADWSGETNGILKDMVEFTKLEHQIEEGNEEDEEAFMQIHQYLRAAVLIIRDELNQADSQTSH
jgi:uncharacterized protein YgfB (UPF0149 family)